MAGTSDGAALTRIPSTLCHLCVVMLQHQLDQLPAIRCMLRFNVKQSIVPQGGGAKVSSSATPSVPINLHALDVMHDIDMALAQGYTIANLIRQPSDGYCDGVDKALDVGIVWRQAESIIGISIAWESRAAPCPKCDRNTLGSYAGSDYISCSDCGTTLTREEYAAHCIAEARKK